MTTTAFACSLLFLVSLILSSLDDDDLALAESVEAKEAGDEDSCGTSAATIAAAAEAECDNLGVFITLESPLRDDTDVDVDVDVVALRSSRCERSLLLLPLESSLGVGGAEDVMLAVSTTAECTSFVESLTTILGLMRRLKLFRCRVKVLERCNEPLSADAAAAAASTAEADATLGASLVIR